MAPIGRRASASISWIRLSPETGLPGAGFRGAWRPRWQARPRNALRVQHPRHACGELAGRQRLSHHNIRVHASHAEIPAHQDYGDRLADTAHFANQGRAGQARHALVGQHSVEALRIGAEGGKRGSAGGEGDRSVAEELERLGGKAHERLLVVHHEHALPFAAWQRQVLVRLFRGGDAASRDTRSTPPCGIACTAFVTRFITTWCTCVESPSIAARPACRRGAMVTFAGSLAASWSSASRTTASTYTGMRSPTPLRLTARMRSTSARPRSPAAMMLSRSRRSRVSFFASRIAISPYPRIAPRMLLKSCAMPPASVPMASIFCDCLSCISRRSFSSCACFCALTS